MQAEKPVFSIYYNTDIDKRYLTTENKVYLIERPDDYSLDSLFGNFCGDTDLYEEIKLANNLNEDRIIVGNYLIVPYYD